MKHLVFFLGLHEKLVEKHGPRGRIIPPAPEKNLVGTTRVKIASNSTSFDGGPHPNDEGKRLNLNKNLCINTLD